MRKFLGYKGRSVWKSFFIKRNKSQLLTLRSIYIIKKDIGKNFYIHNGRFFYKLVIGARMVGFKLGQFILTKKLGMQIHLKNIKKKSNVKSKSIKKSKK